MEYNYMIGVKPKEGMAGPGKVFAMPMIKILRPTFAWQGPYICLNVII